MPKDVRGSSMLWELLAVVGALAAVILLLDFVVFVAKWVHNG